jgi:hypothetical protein
MSMRNVLNENVLVLNRLWQAINVCTVERAFMLLYMGHAEVVIEDGGDFQTFDFHEWREFSQGPPWRGRRPHHFIQDSRAAGDPAAVLRPAAAQGSEIHAAQYFRARPQHVPVLRRTV